MWQLPMILLGVGTICMFQPGSRIQMRETRSNDSNENQVEVSGKEAWVWNHCCRIDVAESLWGNHGCGINAVESMLRHRYCGIFAAESMLWDHGCEIKLWKHCCGIDAAKSLLWTTRVGGMSRKALKLIAESRLSFSSHFYVSLAAFEVSIR